jgi:hypothetical protein
VTRDGVSNSISGGVIIGPVVMGRDITVTLPPQVPPALSGLPAASGAFTGRESDLAAVLDVLRPPGGEAPGVGGAVRAAVVTAVGGLGGIGKTELAVQAAHTALGRGWFPGGVLFVDMFGYDERRRDATHALGGLLRALGVPDGLMPADAFERARMYHSILAEFARRDRRILVVADNVNAQQQAELLLPGDGANAALVTSRHTLAMLDARLLDLDALAEDTALAMLERVLHAARPGDDRLSRHPEHAAELVRLCAGLPLALRIAAALLAENPRIPVAALAAELRAGAPLAGLTYGAADVRATFELSYRSLSVAQRRMFRLFTVNPGAETDTEVAAALAGWPLDKARDTIKALARAHLIEQGSEYGRWKMHDLVHQYARGLSRSASHAPEWRRAVDRLVRYYSEKISENGRYTPAPWAEREHETLWDTVLLAHESGNRYERWFYRLVHDLFEGPD